MRHLTLIRHGLTTWNVEGYFQGHSDLPLSSKGKAQAEALGLRLFSKVFDLVYSSPLTRAVQTANIALPKASIIYDDRLKELNFGIFEGNTLEENKQSKHWQRWYQDTFKRCAPKGESYEMLRTRAVKWLESLPKDDDINIVAFTHSGTIQMLISHFLGVEHPRWRKRILLHHTSLSRVVFQGTNVVIECINDAKHLETGAIRPQVARVHLEKAL